MQKLLEILWAALAALSLVVFFCLLFTEGFIAGKAWVYLIVSPAAAFIFLRKRKKRLGKINTP